MLVHFLAWRFTAAAGVVGSVHDLGGKAFRHGLLTALAAEFHQPAQRQSLTAFGADLDRHLIGGTAHAAGLDFQLGSMTLARAALNTSSALLPVFSATVSKAVVADVLRSAALAIAA